MPGTIVPNQMYDHELNPLKGWFHMHSLDKSATLAAGETIYAGSVCYLNSAGAFRSGLPENVLGMFAFPNSTDFDVSADVGNIQSQNLMALPTTGAYEVQTTEFDERYAYNVNDYLTAWDTQKDGYLAAYRGQVYPGTPYEDTLVGIVSAGAATNDFGKQILTLWTYHLPIEVAGS